MLRNRYVLFGYVLVAVVFAFDGSGVQAQRGHGRANGRPTGAGRPEGASQKPPKPQDKAAKPQDKSARPDREGRGGRPSVEQLAARNPQLAAKLQALLPGMDLTSASDGFRNFGQFVAAAHVSHNLDIPFDQLKGRVTGPGALSLGRAIQELKPGVDAGGEAKKASKSAESDLRESDKKSTRTSS